MKHSPFRASFSAHGERERKRRHLRNPDILSGISPRNTVEVLHQWLYFVDVCVRRWRLPRSETPHGRSINFQAFEFLKIEGERVYLGFFFHPLIQFCYFFFFEITSSRACLSMQRCQLQLWSVYDPGVVALGMTDKPICLAAFYHFYQKRAIHRQPIPP